MSRPERVVVVVAHPDDWQIFAGAAIYEHLRNPEASVTFVTLTAGDGGNDSRHWKSRYSGAVMSVLRGLPSWSAHDLGAFTAAALPSHFRVDHERVTLGGKAVLATTIRGSGGAAVRMYALNLPDGGMMGEGFAPEYASLRKLRSGAAARSLWPEGDGAKYASWTQLIDTLAECVTGSPAAAGGRALIYAPDPDPESNPGDHSDHVEAGLAARELCARDRELAPRWIAMYDAGNRPANLSDEGAHIQRAAICSYGAGYLATAAGVSERWRTGWERERVRFGARQFLREEDEARE